MGCHEWLLGKLLCMYAIFSDHSHCSVLKSTKVGDIVIVFYEWRCCYFLLDGVVMMVSFVDISLVCVALLS